MLTARKVRPPVREGGLPADRHALEAAVGDAPSAAKSPTREALTNAPTCWDFGLYHRLGDMWSDAKRQSWTTMRGAP